MAGTTPPESAPMRPFNAPGEPAQANRPKPTQTDKYISAPTADSRRPSPAPEDVPKSNMRARGRSIALFVGGATLAVLAAAGAWHFYGSGVQTTPNGNASGQGQISAIIPAATPSIEAPAQPSAPAALPDKPALEPKSLDAKEDAKPSIEAPAEPSAPASLPDNSAPDPKSLDAKEDAKLSIDAEQMPAGLDFTVVMNGKIYFQRSAEGNKAKYENLYVPQGVQEFQVTAQSADEQKKSNIVSGEFTAKKRKTLKVELRLQGQREDRGVPQGLYSDTQIVLTLK